MSKIIEIFGYSRNQPEHIDWASLIREQHCPYLQRRCIKVRKSQPDISIGTCSVIYGKNSIPVIICPHRLLVVCQEGTDGYNRFNLIRASSVVNRQSTGEEF
jgi:hypothetical protein